MQADAQVAGAQQQRVVRSLQPQRPERHAPQVHAPHALPVCFLLRPLPGDQDQHPRQLWLLPCLQRGKQIQFESWKARRVCSF